jgi:Holliday junction resolvase-like predicted endonuclease
VSARRRGVLGFARRWRPADPLGRRGERVAARTMRRAGCRVLRRNLVLTPGEADLVCLAPDRRTLVIVEVKSRRRDDGDAAPPPEAAITKKKRATLLRVAHAAASKLRMTGAPLRIDVVAIDFPSRGRPVVRHYENAVRR